MKVLMTADAVGGVWTYAQELCAALPGADVQVLLAVMGPAPSEAQRRSIQRLANVELRCAEFNLEWMTHPWRDVDRASDWLLALAERTRPNVIHLNGYVHAALPWDAPVLVAAHSCVASWWQAVHGKAAPSEWDEYRVRVGAGLQAADRIVAPSQAFLTQLEAAHGPLPNSTVIHNARTPARELHATEKREHFVFSAGRVWDQAKNLLVLDAAARDLPWPVFIAGDTTGPTHRQSHCSHAKLLGALSPEAVAVWLGQAGIYASTALYEPFGLAILEAALGGCALVLSDIPSFRELWTDAAVFVPAGDAQAVHRALSELIADARRLRNLAESARGRARHFSTTRMAAAYLGLYRRLLESSRIDARLERFAQPCNKRLQLH